MMPLVDTPAFEDILAARKVIAPILHRTPLLSHALLCQHLGADVWVKHENHHAVGAFKVRGGLNLVASLHESERKRGLLCVTRGNHGMSLAFAGRRFNVPVTIVVPVGNNPEKNAAMQALGGRLVVHGRDYDEAREHAETFVQKHDYRYVHSANEPLLIAGVATYALEIFEDLPEPDYIFVPVGLGSGICGVCLVAERFNSRARIVGVQAEGAPAVTLTFREGRTIRTESADTFADGVATRVPAESTMSIMRRRVDDMVLVSEQELAEAVQIMWRTTHNLAEGAGAAALAAAQKFSGQIAGKKVVLVLSGGNLDSQTLRRVFGQDNG